MGKAYMGNALCTIDALDQRNQQQLDALLEQKGIRRDRNLSYTCGIFDEDMRLIATGSSFGSTPRCLAVFVAHRGKHLINEVITHLLERQLAEIAQMQGRFHCETALFYANLSMYSRPRPLSRRRTGS